MFADLDNFLDGRCPLTVGGKTYYVPEPTAIEGIRLQRLFANPETELSDPQELDEIQRILGPVWDEFEADKVGTTKAIFAGRVALIYYAMGKEKALIYASGGIDDPGNPLPRVGPNRTSPSRGRTDTGTQAAVPGSNRLGRGRGSTTSRLRPTRGIQRMSR